MPSGPVSVEQLADDAAEVLEALGITSAHVAGFSGGSIVSQELALRHPALVRSLVLQSTWPVMDHYMRTWLLFVRWLVEVAPSERAFLEGFYLDIYTPRAQRRHGRGVHRGGPRLPAQADHRGRAALHRHLGRPRHERAAR